MPQSGQNNKKNVLLKKKFFHISWTWKVKQLKILASPHQQLRISQWGIKEKIGHVRKIIYIVWYSIYLWNYFYSGKILTFLKENVYLEGPFTVIIWIWIYEQMKIYRLVSTNSVNIAPFLVQQSHSSEKLRWFHLEFSISPTP